MITDPDLAKRPTTAVPGHLTVPGARLYFEVRGSGPLLLLVGAPMDAIAFAPLADALASDFTVVTTDPRGINRSAVDDPEQDSTPGLRADDLALLIDHIGTGPAAVFGSSGGAVTALALAQSHPGSVHTVVAHEPPLITLLDDLDAQRAQIEDYVATYLDGDVAGAWQKFFDTANIVVPDGVLEQMFGGERDPQVVADERFWFAHEMRGSDFWEPDLAALRDGAPTVLVAAGAESTGQACDRTSSALAAALDVQRWIFPGDHTGFVGRPDAFAVLLRDILARG